MRRKQLISTIISVSVAIMAVAGFFFIFGAVGTVDYYEEINEYYPLSNTIKTLITGLLLIIPSIIYGRLR